MSLMQPRPGDFSLEGYVRKVAATEGDMGAKGYYFNARDVAANIVQAARLLHRKVYVPIKTDSGFREGHPSYHQLWEGMVLCGLHELDACDFVKVALDTYMTELEDAAPARVFRERRFSFLTQGYLSGYGLRQGGELSHNTHGRVVDIAEALYVSKNTLIQGLWCCAIAMSSEWLHERHREPARMAWQHFLGWLEHRPD